MKENLISDKSLIYQWNFNDNSSVVDNPRVKATVNGNPTFKDGVAIFNGNTDYYKLKTLINLGTKYSIEVRFKLNVISDVSIVGNDGSIYGMYIIGNIIYHRAKDASIDANINWVRDTNWHTYTICRNGINVTIFFDGILIKTLTNYNFSYCLINSIGATNIGAAKLNGSIEYIKIWNRQLTASEVKNNYNGKTYRSLPYISSEKVLSKLSLDFNNWTNGSSTVINSTTISHTINGGGSYKTGITEIGKVYKITIIGTTTNCALKIQDWDYSPAYTIPTSFTGSFNYSGIFIATGTKFSITFQSITGTGTITFTTFIVEEVLQSSKNTLFHINSDNGIIRDLTGKTIPVATNVALPKIGSNIDVMKFNNISGNINLGNQALVGDITFMGWCNPTTFGEGNEGYMISNTKFQLLTYITNKAIQISRNGFSNAAIVNNLVKLSNVLFICVISTSTGITNFYIGDKNNPPTLSGTANQAAGTPVAGTTCYLGNRAAADDRTLNGWLNDVRLDQSILTLEEVTQYWSSTKQKYQ